MNNGSFIMVHYKAIWDVSYPEHDVFMGINYFEKYINYILYIFYVETLLMTLQTYQIRLRQRGLSSAVRSIVSSLCLRHLCIILSRQFFFFVLLTVFLSTIPLPVTSL